MARTQVEHEVKLDVAEDAAVPDLTDLPGVVEVRTVEVDLTATYFDTADLRVLRSRMTLRRRVGGEDEGWHLKRPVVGDQRSETHLPLGRATRTVPAPLRRLVRAATRDAELAPVATLETHRTVHRLQGPDDVVLAEVCDDVVRARVLAPAAQQDDAADGAAGDDAPAAPDELTWREWEVELVDGDMTLLDAAVARLRTAGARPAGRASKVGGVLEPLLAQHATPASSGLKKSRAGDVVWRYLDEQRTRLHALDPAVRGDEPDAVHQMRVSARRLRSVLGVYGPLLGPEAVDALRSDLQTLGRVLGDARDAEVLRERLVQGLDELDGEVAVAPARRRLGRDDAYRAAHDAVVAHLDGDAHLAMLDRLDVLLAEPDWHDLARRKATALLPGRLKAADRRLRRAVRRVRKADPGPARDLALHEARKAAKRARYAAEAAAPALGKRATRYAEAVEAVQTALGEHQDSVATRQALEQLAGSGQSGESYVWGVLHGIELRRAEDSRAAFDAAWREVRRGRVRRVLKR